MKPDWMTDELGQWHAWSFWRHHYIVGISHDKTEALKRWDEALKAAK